MFTEVLLLERLSSVNQPNRIKPLGLVSLSVKSEVVLSVNLEPGKRNELKKGEDIDDLISCTPKCSDGGYTGFPLFLTVSSFLQVNIAQRVYLV